MSIQKFGFKIVVFSLYGFTYRRLSHSSKCIFMFTFLSMMFDVGDLPVYRLFVLCIKAGIPRRRHPHPHEDPRDDVGVGASVVECELKG